jgi:sulfatase modifying factor 1
MLLLHACVATRATEPGEAGVPRILTDSVAKVHADERSAPPYAPVYADSIHATGPEEPMVSGSTTTTGGIYDAAEVLLHRHCHLAPASSDATASPHSGIADFVYVESGRFVMGSPIDEAGRHTDEMQHEVELTRPFCLQATEVTQAQWEQLMGTNPARFSACGPQCPVERVSWMDAVNYANTRSRIEGLQECYGPNGETLSASIYDCEGFRLPTEAEWEFAARAGTLTATYGELSQVAWHMGNSAGSTRPVGQLLPNDWGLHDMLGNVFEWTHDWYGDYEPSALNPAGPDSGIEKVFRGGRWNNMRRRLRVANRVTATPDCVSDSVGFRLAIRAPEL